MYICVHWYGLNNSVKMIRTAFSSSSSSSSAISCSYSCCPCPFAFRERDSTYTPHTLQRLRATCTHSPPWRSKPRHRFASALPLVALSPCHRPQQARPCRCFRVQVAEIHTGQSLLRSEWMGVKAMLGAFDRKKKRKEEEEKKGAFFSLSRFIIYIRERERERARSINRSIRPESHSFSE